MMGVYLVPLIQFIAIYSQFFSSNLSPFLPLKSPPPPLPLYLLQSARLTPSPPYVSLHRQHCQPLEHITANCATCGSLTDRKKWMGQHYANRAGVGVYL